MSRAVPDRLRDILKAIDRCQAYRAPMTSADRSLSAMAEDAVLRNIGVIGEAVNHLPDDLARWHPEVDWAAIVGMRNVVVHEYFGVDIAMLLDVLDTDLPQLADVLSAELEGGSAG